MDIQRTEFLRQETLVVEKIKTLENTIQEKIKQWTQWVDTHTDEIVEKRKMEIIKHQTKIWNIKTFLTTIQRKTLQEQYASYQELQTVIREKDKAIIIQETLSKERENYVQQKEKNEGILQSLHQDIEVLVNKKILCEKEKEEIQIQVWKITQTPLSEIERLSTQINNIQRDIQTIIRDFKNIQTEINQLIIEEKQLNQLYQILSKELALLILQDHLPTLNDIINSFLNQVVDYQISLNLTKTSTDKIELEANIIDTKWEREIKSLSGWQKIILKLVWMLAISAYMNSPILFLDETINNLDNDTVWKVADMLQDTVKQRNIKLYTVTHNQQIQDMNIRDAKIELGNIVWKNES